MEIKNNLSFIKQYITKPRSVGAILPSSNNLARKMISYINFDKARYIVEYGPGTGVFTDEMLKKRKEDTLVLLLECNTKFYKQLKQKYSHEPNLLIINDSAEHLEKYLLAHNIPQVDYIISGLPFASLPPEVSSNILTQTKKYLSLEGRFITFQYTLLKKDFIGAYFDDIKITKEVRNIPPAYILCCRQDT